MGQWMTPGDAMWYLGETPENPMTISSLLWFDAPIDVAALRARIDARLLERFPVLTQRIDPPRLPGLLPRWEDDPRFDLGHHLDQEQLTGAGDHEQVQQRVSEQRSTPLDRERAMWRLSVLQGYRGHGSVVHARIHHSIGDGLALMQVMRELVDDPPDEQLMVRDVSRAGRAVEMLGFGREMLANGTRLARHPTAVARLARDTGSAAVWAGRLLAPQLVERSILQGRPDGRKQVVWDPDGFELDELKAQARANGVTINDLVMAVLAGGLHRYLAARDGLVREVAVMVPINLRREGDALPRHLGNRIGLLPIRLPVGTPDPLERLTGVRRRILELRGSPAPLVSRALMAATSLATPTVERTIHRVNQLRGTGVVTNVPGPRAPMHLTGARMLGTIGWGGMTGHLNLSVAFISLAGRVFPGLVTDAAITPDPQALLDDVLVAYDELIAALPGDPARFPAG